MSMVFIVLPLALFVAAIAVGAYVWATRDGQFDDLVTPAARILHDDEEAVGPGESGETVDLPGGNSPPGS